MGGKKLINKDKDYVFNNTQTNIAKGIGILLLLWHHLFYNSKSYFDKFTTIKTIGNIPVECWMATLGKACVALFLILSGYGMYKSWKSFESKSPNKRLGIKDTLYFIKKHLLKLMFGYWFIYILFVPISIFVGEPFWSVYEKNILYAGVDFLGLAKIFGTPTMNPTWWFMGVIIVYYIVFPLIMKLMDYSPELMLVIACVISMAFLLPIKDYGEVRKWFLPFIMGVYFAHYDFFLKVDNKLNTMWKKLFVSGGLVFVFSVLRINNSRIGVLTLLAVAVILFTYMVLSRIPILSKVLEELGKSSSNIFMFHTFIFLVYFPSYVYGLKYAPLIYVAFLAVCYVISKLIDLLRKVLFVDKLLELCIKR